MDSEITLEAVPSAGDVPADEWNACANPPASFGFNGLEALASPGSAGASCADPTPYSTPFVSHAFFAAAETSGSAIVRTGWGPRHLLAKVGGQIAGIVPCYLKSHSQGGYVFDLRWAVR